MAASRKLYEEIASTLSVRGNQYVLDAHTQEFYESIVNGLAADFKADNPRFNTELFLKACGLEGLT